MKFYFIQMVEYFLHTRLLGVACDFQVNKFAFKWYKCYDVIGRIKVEEGLVLNRKGDLMKKKEKNHK